MELDVPHHLAGVAVEHQQMAGGVEHDRAEGNVLDVGALVIRHLRGRKRMGGQRRVFGVRGREDRVAVGPDGQRAPALNASKASTQNTRSWSVTA